MRPGIQSLQAIALAGIVLMSASCAGTLRDVDTTPTARTTVDTHIGKSLTADNQRIRDIEDSFQPTETIYAVVDVPGSREGTLRVRWVFGAMETLREQSMMIQANTHSYLFQLDPKDGGHSVGDYRLEVYVDDAQADSENFRVQAG
jgi:hypothetical protein